jgi:hypothetical protein
VWGTASIIPKPCSDLYDAVVVRGDLNARCELWANFYPICEFL